MATLGLWLDGNWGEESSGWWEETTDDVNRLLSDERYGELMSVHIQRTLKNLATELDLMAMLARGEGYDMRIESVDD